MRSMIEAEARYSIEATSTASETTTTSPELLL